MILAILSIFWVTMAWNEKRAVVGRSEEEAVEFGPGETVDALLPRLRLSLQGRGTDFEKK